MSLGAVLLRGIPAEKASEAIRNEYGPPQDMTEQAAETLLGKLRRAKNNLEASAGDTASSPAGAVEPTVPGSGSPAEGRSAGETPQPGTDGSSPGEEAQQSLTGDAPAGTPFKAPTGPRGSKRARRLPEGA